MAEDINPATTTGLLQPTAALRRRHRAERWFRRLGLAAIILSLAFIGLLFFTIIKDGYPAFTQTYIDLEIDFAEAAFTRENLATADYPGLVKQALHELFPDVTSGNDSRLLNNLASPAAANTLHAMVEANPRIIGTRQKVRVLASNDVDKLMKGRIDGSLPANERRIPDIELHWIDQLRVRGLLERSFNKSFFTSGDSRQPESAGILGALKGSLLTLVITLSLSFPVGVAAAVYLEEFAPSNVWTDIVEININNLAAVPSIIFGLLGLAIFINFLGLPRSTPIVGGMVLSLMTLPTIIIAGRASLKSVPPSTREAALSIGASNMQTVMHHVLPSAMPGMLTGTIIGMAHALGETAPLLMIGMVAFVADIPGGFTDPATLLPVQIYLWAESPEPAFTEKASAAILVLLGLFLVMNTIAVLLRKKFKTKW